MPKYYPTIGIETHVQLKTKTKLFAAVGNDARDAEPNTLISHICAGMPGALPVLNQAALELSACAAFALNTKPQKHSYFERKHYFYPDSPAGYQISQLHAPIIIGGSVEIDVDGQKKTIDINRAQLEADAGKNTHPAGADYSLVDLNRAGTPLLEVVSEPQINSAAEAKAYARELYLLMKYAGVTDGDMYHGNVRFDVNVSLSSDPDKLGTRAEIKNLNSFKSVEGSVEYEIKRQSELLDKGQPVVQETRGWDEVKQITTAQRGKEEAKDYRYMPEPDVPPIEFSEGEIDDLKKDIPLLPPAIRIKLAGLDVDKKVVEDILDKPELCAKVLETIHKAKPDQAKFIVFQSLKLPETLGIDVEEHIELAELVASGQINRSVADDVAIQRSNSKSSTIHQIIQSQNLSQVSDENEIDKIVAEVLGENAKAAEDVKNGELKAIGFLVGQVMAKSGGKANPGLAQQLIKKQLQI